MAQKRDTARSRWQAAMLISQRNKARAVAEKFERAMQDKWHDVVDKKNEELEEKLVACKTERDELHKALGSAKEEHAGLVATLRDEATKLQAERDEFKQEADDLEEAKDDLEKELEKLHEDLDEQTHQNLDLLAEVHEHSAAKIKGDDHHETAKAASVVHNWFLRRRNERLQEELDVYKVGVYV